MEFYENFKVVTIKFFKSSDTAFQIFWKPHCVKEHNAKKPGGRTLFVINIPSFVTKDSLVNMMSQFGEVTNIYFHKKPDLRAPPHISYPIFDPEDTPKGFKVGYIVFKDAKSIELAMRSVPADSLLASKENPITSGVAKWYEEYNSSFQAEELLQKEVEQIMNDYDERIAREKELAEAEGIPDDEGWVTVSSRTKKKKPALKMTPAKTAKRIRKKKKKELHNFYDFQRKEVNMKHLDERRKKFEADGRRMALMRSSRKFKPL